MIFKCGQHNFEIKILAKDFFGRPFVQAYPLPINYSEKGLKIEELTKYIQLPKISINFEKYGYPNNINSKAVGITINNLETYDLTDICLKLIELKKSQFNASSSESIRSILIRIGDYDCNFDLSGDFRIRADDKRDIRLGELRDGELFFLVKDPFNPESWFQEQQPGISMPNAIWELKFELRGKTPRNNFRKKVFYTRIGMVGKTVNIGGIICVEK